MAGIDAFGTVWELHDGVGVYPLGLDAVAEVTSIDVVDVSVESIETTSHDSANQWREFVGGLKDGGELSMELNYDPAAHGTIFDAIGATRQHRITLTDAGAATVEFEGHVNGFSAGAPYDDKLTATVTIKVSGAVSITP